MWKRMLLMLFLVVLFIAGIAFWKYKQIQAGMAMGAKFAPPPAAVTTVVVDSQTWQPALNAVGSMRAVQGVIVSTDLAGIVAEVAFESGTEVKKGALLVSLDSHQEQAQLRAAEARLELAKTDLTRKRELVAKKAIAAAEMDTAQSELQQAEAMAADAQALIQRKRIMAPFDGVAGIRQVNVGQYLNPGASIVSLQSMDPIYVEFSLPQQHLATIENGSKLRLGASGVDGERVEGEITAIEPAVDASTRNVMVQGTVKNAEQKLRPGMFVDVEVLLPEKEGVLAIPSSAIAYAPYGDSVYVVKDGAGPDGKPMKTVQQQFVKLGPKRGDQVSVLSGLNAGDEVVSAGVFRLRPNAPVQVNNTVQPSNELQPTPPNT
jgi:membrane fusion protein (multidrug efflux system)